MFKKLRERIYNRKIEKELKDIEFFDSISTDFYFSRITFIKYPKNEDLKLFKPQTVYAIKRAIQKLSKDYCENTTINDFEKIIERAFQYAGFDKERKAECIELFKTIQKGFENKKNEELINR